MFEFIRTNICVRVYIGHTFIIESSFTKRKIWLNTLFISKTDSLSNSTTRAYLRRYIFFADRYKRTYIYRYILLKVS